MRTSLKIYENRRKSMKILLKSMKIAENLGKCLKVGEKKKSIVFLRFSYVFQCKIKKTGLFGGARRQRREGLADGQKSCQMRKSVKNLKIYENRRNSTKISENVVKSNKKQHYFRKTPYFLVGRLAAGVFYLFPTPPPPRIPP